MPRKARLRSRSGVYHIMLRGANKQEIFHDEEDCIQFLNIIAKYKPRSELSIYAWCLMNNHVHILMKEGNEDISITMKRIGVSFVSYYNRKYRTTGHLFQDRFRSENVENVRYLLTVIRYIHQNPVKAGIVKEVDHWRWSSCVGYYGKPTYFKNLLDMDPILGMFSEDLAVAKKRFKAFNEQFNQDTCLNDRTRRRLTDDEGREKIKKLLDVIEIAQVKSLPKLERNDLLRKIKTIDGISNRQAARILGVSPSLINKV